MHKNKIIAIFKRLQELNPQPTTELKFQSTFELLIAVMLSAQATDVSVNKATVKLFPIANTPTQLLALGREGLEHYVKSINLYRTKAKHIILTCNRLIEHFKGEVPKTREALESLPGVGRKTANVILNTAFHEPTIAVDTHIFRVAHRLGLAQGKTPLAVEQELLKIIPPSYRQDAHHWLILHGRYICKAQRPQCDRCPVSKWCEYENKILLC